jgi:hypothetical protein
MCYVVLFWDVRCCADDADKPVWSSKAVDALFRGAVLKVRMNCVVLLLWDVL